MISITSIEQVYAYLKKDKQNFRSAVIVYSAPLFAKILSHFSASRRLGLLHGEAAIIVPDRPDLVFVLSNGFGPSSAAMLLEELVFNGVSKVITLGFAGGLSDSLKLGSIWQVSSAWAEEAVSIDYIREKETLFPRWYEAPIPVAQVVGEIKTWTTANPYRETPEKLSMALGQSCLAVDMECSVVFAIANFYKIECQVYLCISDHLTQDSWSLAWKAAQVKDNLERAVLSALQKLII